MDELMTLSNLHEFVSILLNHGGWLVSTSLLGVIIWMIRILIMDGRLTATRLAESNKVQADYNLKLQVSIDTKVSRDEFRDHQKTQSDTNIKLLEKIETKISKDDCDKKRDFCYYPHNKKIEAL